MTNLPEVLLLAGACAVSYGVSLIYIPAGWIVGGVLACGAGYLIEKGRK